MTSVVSARIGLTNVATEQCTCPLYHGVQMGRNILCPIHGDVRDTGIIELCDLCGRPLGHGERLIHKACADYENMDRQS